LNVFNITSQAGSRDGDAGADLNMFKKISRGAAMSIVVTYLAYLLISVSLTFLAGRVLSRSGRLILADALGGDSGTARGISNLVVVSFYLISLGCVALAMHTSSDSLSARQAIQLLATKVGVDLLVLGGLYLAGLVILTKLRRKLKAQAGVATTKTGDDRVASELAGPALRAALWRPTAGRGAP
jgi:hypothetical protein